ncbi:DUF3302 domain-containing protein [Shewanella acanthi]|uniref:DUF3302 domain-containing protein n=1 Tax=Shewanella acanthi TaxID=2864212 RepID=UPI001C660985|nr:DUF3302 domain-containing protein [Shewanella acanthi]QYJ78126.1 DUF3302 domain-containing protein [Shewanella acanthi]
MFLDYFALGILFFVVLVIFYGSIAIHDIPYEIAKKRNHPQQDALHIAGWISLFTLHVLWPFLWIWATLYREDRGWGFSTVMKKEEALEEDVKALRQTVLELQSKIVALELKSAEAPELKQDPIPVINTPKNNNGEV